MAPATTRAVRGGVRLRGLSFRTDGVADHRGRRRRLAAAACAIGLSGAAAGVGAAELVEVGVVDRDFLVVHVSDGEVIHHEGAIGEEVVRHLPVLDTGIAVQTGRWTVTSAEDPAYGGGGLHPLGVARKKKLSGHAQMEWIGSDFRYEYTYDHWIYLELPSPMLQGMSYTLAIDPATRIDVASRSVIFDVFTTPSEAVHVNLVGYAPDAPHKAADLYQWMGSGGARDYSGFEGNTVYLVDALSGEATPVGEVAFWMAGGSDVFWYNLTRSDVWSADFSASTTPGAYRLAVEGVGCSREFVLADDVYATPFAVAVLGYFYMRIGESNPGGIVPPPRTPLYLPGVSPPETAVYLTTMQPWHPEWGTFSSGDRWDRPNDWIPYRKPGNPTNPNAWGGHSDAADWDRHLGHVVNIYDLLLPFFMTAGAMSDDDLGITESGNGIPDLLDEARNEVDFWLRLRDGDAYSHGLTNPNGSSELFQAGPTAAAAWANAVNAAMLADAFRVAGLTSLADHYRDEAVAAYGFADALADPMLDEGIEVDTGLIRGRDLKMTAAAHLYNLTGDTSWEDVVFAESVCAAGPATINNLDRNQIWGTAAYLVTPQTVHRQAMWNSMRTAIIAEARSREADLMDGRPSRRATDQVPAYFRTGQHVDRTIIAHAVTDDPVERSRFRKALALEADWGLGRNPMNRIHMTTAHSPLAGKRGVPEAYTSGMDDGVPGVHPGHTPYMNLDDWGSSMVMGRPSALYEESFPGDVQNTWPIGECYFPSRWVWAHNEFTPRQTMRGKTALYGYLYGLSGEAPPPFPTLAVTNSSIAGATGAVGSSPPGIDCGADCSEPYANGTVVTLTADPAAGSRFAGWSGACFGAAPTCEVVMTANRAVTATFEPEGLTYTLTVVRTGTGDGAVTSTPPGIDCGADCTEPYLGGTTVSLEATAAGGSTFAGWTGACSGSGGCSVAMSAARSVTAEFRSDTVPAAVVYDDALASGWADWSWNATIDLAATSPVHAGAHSVNATLDGWGAFSPAMPSGQIDTWGYDAIRFWVHGGGGADKLLRFFSEGPGGQSAEVDFTAAAGVWTEITITLGELGGPAAIARLNFMNNSAAALTTVAFDEIRFEPAAEVGGIFADGFESGDTATWSAAVPAARRTRSADGTAPTDDGQLNRRDSGFQPLPMVDWAEH